MRNTLVSQIASPINRTTFTGNQNPDDNTAVSGNMIDFYGTGTVLNLPMGMYEKPQGDGKAEKVD